MCQVIPFPYDRIRFNAKPSGPAKIIVLPMIRVERALAQIARTPLLDPDFDDLPY